MNGPACARLGLALCIVFWFSKTGATLQEAVPGDSLETSETIDNDIRKTASRFLQAYRTGDEPGMQAVAGRPDIDPFLLAHALLRIRLLSSEETGDELSAAVALGKRIPGQAAGRKLLDLIQAWQAFSEEDRAREVRLLSGLDRIRTANLAGSWTEVASIAGTLHDDLEPARNSLTAVLARMGIAAALRNDGQAKEARIAWRPAAAGAEQIAWDAGLAVVRILARLHRIQPRDQEHLVVAPGISRTIGDRPGVWFGYRNLGVLEMNRRRYPEAVRYAKLAVEAAKRAGNRAWQGESRNNLGIVYQRMGKLEQACSVLERAAVDMKAAQNLQGQAFALGNLGNTLRLMGRYEEARDRYTTVIQAFEALNHRPGLASSLLNRGAIHMRSARYSEALDDFDRARKLKEELGDRVGVHKILSNSGHVHLQLGHFGKARDELEASVDFFRKNKILHLLDEPLFRLGQYCQSTSQFARALEQYEEVLRLTRNPLTAAKAQGSMAVIQSALGRNDAALDHLERAQKAFERIQSRHDVAVTLQHRGRICVESGRHEEAMALFTRAERLLKETGFPNALLAEKALLHVREGRPDLALECHRRACESGINPFDIAYHRIDMGALLGELGRNREALAQFKHAADRLEGFGDTWRNVTLWLQMGILHLRMDHPEKALAAVKRGLGILSRLGHGLSAEDRFGQRAEARMASDIGFRAARKLLETGTGDRAAVLDQLFGMAEAGRGLLLAEELLNRDVLRDALLSPELRDAETTSRMRVKAIRKELQDLYTTRTPDPAAVDRARNALRAAYHDLEESVSRVKRSARRVAAVLYPEPAPLRKVQQRLSEEEAFIHFDLPADEGRASALVVTRDEVVLVPLEATGRLSDRLDRFLRLVSVDRTDERSIQAPGLYDALLRPVEKALGGKKRLIISPDGKLAYLPFEALIRTDGDRIERVIERWEVTYVPSATVLLSLRTDEHDQPKGQGVLALGDPVYAAGPREEKDVGKTPEACLRGLGTLRRLKESGREVTELARLFPAPRRTVLLREEASVAGFRTALGNLSGRLAAVHLACHARLDTRRPRLTGLVLSGGEVLTLDDIYQLEIPADLAVLSACSTAQGKVERGEGVVGLVRGFFLAGCPRVVVSDWDVKDAVTRRFMVALYRNMLERGLVPAAALRATKLDLIRNDPDRAHPAHWAAFVLWGLGK